MIPSTTPSVLLNSWTRSFISAHFSVGGRNCSACVFPRQTLDQSVAWPETMLPSYFQILLQVQKDRWIKELTHFVDLGQPLPRDPQELVELVSPPCEQSMESRRFCQYAPAGPSSNIRDLASGNPPASLLARGFAWYQARLSRSGLVHHKGGDLVSRKWEVCCCSMIT